MRLLCLPFAVPVLLLLLTQPLASCKKTLVTKTIDVKLNADLPLNVQPADPLAGVWGTDLNPDDNVDVRTNRSKIKQINADRLTFTVKDYSGAGGITSSGTWQFAPSDAPGDVLTLVSVSNVDFKGLQDSNAEQELALSDAAKTKLVDLINSRKKITFSFAGNVTDKPVYAILTLHLYTRVQVAL